MTTLPCDTELATAAEAEPPAALDWWRNMDWRRVAETEPRQPTCYAEITGTTVIGSLFELHAKRQHAAAITDALITDSPSDDSLDSRSIKPNPLIWPATPAPPTPAQAGVARAAARLCGGYEPRAGAVDYGPER